MQFIDQIFASCIFTVIFGLQANSSDLTELQVWSASRSGSAQRGSASSAAFKFLESKWRRLILAFFKMAVKIVIVTASFVLSK